MIIKNEKQINGIRKSCQLAAKTLKFIKPYVQTGITTDFLDQKIAEFIKKHNAIAATLNYKGFPKSCCISVNDVICHGIPNDYVLKDGDILNVDVATILNGYYGDTGTMFTVGKISEKAQKLLTVAKNCLDIGIEQVKPGNYFNNIGYEITKYALANGCTVNSTYAGHEIGKNFHESFQICHYYFEKNVGLKMIPNLTFTIEPMINNGKQEVIIDKDNWTARTIDGELSAQYEHTCLLSKDGCEILTIML